jgi:hypothetical protein
MKCIWCNKPCGPEITVEDKDGTYACCSEECRHKSEKFLRFGKRFSPLFLGLIIACTVALIALSVTAPRLVSLPMAAMGFVILFFPFCTPQTVQALGLKKSVLIGRIVGVIVIALGIFMYFWI